MIPPTELSPGERLEFEPSQADKRKSEISSVSQLLAKERMLLCAAE